MKIRNGTQSSRMRHIALLLSAGSWLTRTLCERSVEIIWLSSNGATVCSGLPSLRLPAIVAGIVALIVTLATALFSTCCMNSEYDTLLVVVLRGLKLWNTAINTTAITTQSNKFLAISFMRMSP